MFTDMVGYSALARENEKIARELVDDQRLIVRESLKRNGGREHQTTGDGFFIEFASAVNAVQSAIEIQTALHERDRHLPENRRIKIRIGIHLGDILTDNEDLFGNGVNIAARVEPLAKPGGICITRQIFDQVEDRIDGVKFKKSGMKDLKNIRGGAEVFHVVLPWEADSLKSKKFVSTWLRSKLLPTTLPVALNSALIVTLTTVCLASLVFATTVALRNAFAVPEPSLRSPAEFVASEPVDLSEGWVFKTAKSANWQKFETHQSWKHADDLVGSYEMSKSFRVDVQFKEPAIVLGLITDTHRAYFNDQFIGGSDRSGDLTYYAVPPGLIKTEGENTIRIEGETRRALNPGLIVLPKIGAFLGEFSAVRQKVHANDMQFHFLRNMYFGLSLLVFVSCFAFSILRRSTMPFMYSSILLLLSALNLAYYSPWISSSFEYPFLRFLKVTALMQTPFVLLSAQLRLLRFSRAEAANNLIAMTALVVTVGLLLLSESSPAGFIENYNRLLAAAAGYSLIATLWMLAVLLKSVRKPVSPFVRSFQYAFAAASVISFGAAFAAIKTNSHAIFSFVDAVTTATGRVAATELGLALPFLFSIFLVVVATLDYLQKSRANRLKHHRERMMLELVRLVGSTKPFEAVVTDIQKMLCEFLKADRSTLYVFDPEDESKNVLVAEYVHHSRPGQFEIKRRISAHYGVIGYVLENQTPLNLTDIRKDRRFFGPEARYKTEGFTSYKTGACMLFPLRSNGQLIGILTFADKIVAEPGYEAFEMNEFKAALELSASLGVLLDNQQMRRALKTNDPIGTAV